MFIAIKLEGVELPQRSPKKQMCKRTKLKGLDEAVAVSAE